MPAFEKLLPEHLMADLHTAYGDPFYKYDNENERMPCYSGQTGEIAFTIPGAEYPGSKSPGRRTSLPGATTIGSIRDWMR